MRNIQRSIEEVRALRGDLSSYLIHLTRSQSRPDSTGKLRFYSAKNVLEQILTSNTLRGLKPVGQFNHSWYNETVQPVDLMAVCLTETPIEHIHLFVGIQGRALNFDSYGLVFDKTELACTPIHAAPVLYFSQPESRDFHFVKTFNKLVDHYNDFKDILFLFDRFGKHANGGDYDWRWEREWRIKSQMDNVREYVKFGLCPEYEINYFEGAYAPIKFVDPFFNSGQIRAKLKLDGILR